MGGRLRHRVCPARHRCRSCPGSPFRSGSHGCAQIVAGCAYDAPVCRGRFPGHLAVAPFPRRLVLLRGRYADGCPAALRAHAGCAAPPTRSGRSAGTPGAGARCQADRSRLLSRERAGFDFVLFPHAAGPPASGMNRALPVTVAITGASGAAYAVRLLESLNRAGVAVRLIVSPTGWRLLGEELDIGDERALRASTGDWSKVTMYADDDRGATPASGSAATRGMVVCPCSMGTLASIAQGTTRSLIERAADVVLKERRTLILVPRETPYSLIHLQNMTRLTKAGALILPASPGFYHRPARIEDLIDFVVGRILAHLGEDLAVGPRWQSGEPA